MNATDIIRQGAAAGRTVTAETISDAQIHTLRRSAGSPRVVRACSVALGYIPVEVPSFVGGAESRRLIRAQMLEDARDACVEAWNRIGLDV